MQEIRQHVDHDLTVLGHDFGDGIRPNRACYRATCSCGWEMHGYVKLAMVETFYHQHALGTFDRPSRSFLAVERHGEVS